MKNILLIVIEMLVCYTSLILLSKKYKTDGIYIYGIIATLLSCIMSLKKIDIFGINIPLGIALTTSIIVAGNLIVQKRGLSELKTYLVLIIITALVSCMLINLSGLLEGSKYNDIANKSYYSIFEYNIRNHIAITISITLSTFISSRIYYQLKRSQNKIIISNIFSMAIIELFESTIFILIAHLFEYELINLILCILFRYTIKIVIGLIGTIPIYISNKID